LNLDAARLRLENLLRQCQSHAARLETAVREIGELGTLDASRLAAACESDAKRIDLLLFRYMRLQDALGGRLFPALLEAGSEEPVESAFIDKLHALERLGVIDSSEAWMELRALRNQMAHDYPDPEIRARILAEAVRSAPELVRALAAALRYARDKLRLVLE
jgi:hypothetical protein